MVGGVVNENVNVKFFMSLSKWDTAIQYISERQLRDGCVSEIGNVDLFLLYSHSCAKPQQNSWI
jgi:hypothetical protein